MSDPVTIRIIEEPRADNPFPFDFDFLQRSGPGP